MPNTKSAKKALKQSDKRHKENVSRKSALKTAIKKVYDAMGKNISHEKVKELVANVASSLARAGSKKVIHKNTASRKLSRISLAVNKHFEVKS